jgi:UDP-N-acetylmuramyl pentapeptide synthase
MAHLWERIPPDRRGAYADTSEGLTKPLLDALGAGDVVMVKGSLGSRMGPVVEAVQARFRPADKDN